MAISYNYVYATDWNGDHYINRFEYTGTPFFERNGAVIFIIGTIVVAYSAFCIVNGIKMIETGQNEGNSSVFKFKVLDMKSFFGILPLDSGGLIIGAISILLGIFLMISLIFSIPYDRLEIQDFEYLIGMLLNFFKFFSKFN